MDLVKNATYTFMGKSICRNQQCQNVHFKPLFNTSQETKAKLIKTKSMIQQIYYEYFSQIDKLFDKLRI